MSVFSRREIWYNHLADVRKMYETSHERGIDMKPKNVKAQIKRELTPIEKKIIYHEKLRKKEMLEEVLRIEKEMSKREREA